MRRYSSGSPSPSSFAQVLRRQKYQQAGSHAAVKKCRWLHMSLVEGRSCYKQRFYGIQSHRCVQMTPTIACNLRCRFCWRTHPEDLPMPAWAGLPERFDEPEKIVEESLIAHRRILSGYRSQVIRGVIDERKYKEALNPRHAAISLDGEPTLYPEIGGLISEFKVRGFTTFLVTNATQPHILKRLGSEPSQLYLSLHAPDEESFEKVCSPTRKGLWRRVLESLEASSGFSCPTVVRLTLARGVNIDAPERYGRIISGAEPTYVEAKAYMSVGYSRLRLGFDYMPTHQEVALFSEKLSKETGYRIVDSSPESRVVLLSRVGKPKELA
ncbi:MAG: 4-demethylwyosine synthase TYW1 [Candidatus Bathyarchaeia archaeon]